MKYLALISAVLFSSLAFANNWYDRGNGGFALFCANQKPQVLDLFENQDSFPMAFASAETAEKKALEIVSRLQGLDPHRASLYREWIQSFSREISFAPSATQFKNTPDAGLVSIPEGCKLEQVVFQRNPSVLNRSRYVVNRDLWNELDTDNQAALIVHEIIYRDFINSRTVEMTSERIRLFNGVLHGNALNGASLKDYLSILKELHFATYMHQNLLLSLGYSNESGTWTESALIFSNDSIERGTLAATQAFERSSLKYICMENTVPELGWAEFDAQGRLVQLHVTEKFRESSSCPLPFMEYHSEQGDFTISGYDWKFASDEQPTEVRGTLSTQSQFQLTYGKNTFVLAYEPFRPSTVETYFLFDENLNLREIGLGGSACRSPLNNTVLFTAKKNVLDDILQLNSEAQITSPLGLCF